MSQYNKLIEKQNAIYSQYSNIHTPNHKTHSNEMYNHTPNNQNISTTRPVNNYYAERIIQNNTYNQPKHGKKKGPSVWGPMLWYSLHNGAANYPPDKRNISNQIKIHMKNWINALPLMIPCADCANHAVEYISRSDLDKAVVDRESLFKYFVDFHNHVNKKLGKRIISLDEAKSIYY